MASLIAAFCNSSESTWWGCHYAARKQTELGRIVLEQCLADNLPYCLLTVPFPVSYLKDSQSTICNDSHQLHIYTSSRTQLNTVDTLVFLHSFPWLHITRLQSVTFCIIWIIIPVHHFTFGQLFWDYPWVLYIFTTLCLVVHHVATGLFYGLCLHKVIRRLVAFHLVAFLPNTCVQQTAHSTAPVCACSLLQN